jgi:lipopolysaccharide export system protein LptA
MTNPTLRAFLAGVAVAVLAGGAAAQAQPNSPANASSRAPQQQPSGPPNALQGFSQNRDKPIKINANTLEVRDKDKVATFMGDVHLVQGDTTLRSRTLVVFYDDDPAAKTSKPPPAASQSGGQGGAQQNQQIKRVEAKGDVIVVQKDQTATGETGVFDMRANTVTLLGNVVISQGPNVVRGEKLTVDMTTGVSLVEAPKCPKPPCRVQMLVTPNSAPSGPKPDGPPGPGPGPGREATRSRSP